jgi:hypothetical protein
MFLSGSVQLGIADKGGHFVLSSVLVDSPQLLGSQIVIGLRRQGQHEHSDKTEAH